MPKKDLPVYNIDTFHAEEHDHTFYANTFREHLEHHHFVNTPHKHDFFLVILFTKGHGTHQVDFTGYPVKPGSVFILSPGQSHSWKLSKDIDGYIFFHTRDFYDSYYQSEKVQDYPFFRSVHHTPLILLKHKQRHKVEQLFKEILDEYQEARPLRLQKLRLLVALFYIDLARYYLPGLEETGGQHYLDQVRRLEGLIDAHFKTEKSPAFYANLMNVSERHLNRMCSISLRKSVSELISDRVVLEAKRMLAGHGHTVAGVAAGLGYFDQSYFARLFKKKSGYTPSGFVSEYR